MLKLENLSLQKGNFSIHGINLEIYSSKTHVLLGPSGSGKTLLLEAILGINKIEKGSIYHKDRMIHDIAIQDRLISYVPQDLCLFPHLNVRENILYPLKFSKSEFDLDRMNSLCSILEIHELLDRSINFLSGGEKQRIAIARALMTDHELLILDEPFSSLHQQLRQELWIQLKQIQKEFHLSILLVTHDLNEALFLGDHLHLIMDGKLHDISRLQYGLDYPKSKSALKFLGIKNFFEISKSDNLTSGVQIDGCEVNLDINTYDVLKLELAVRSDDIKTSVIPFDSTSSGFNF
jgi:molybdate/tungstate transport system ATP-binding protein